MSIGSAWWTRRLLSRRPRDLGQLEPDEPTPLLYLDQKHWIGLAQVRAGKATAEETCARRPSSSTYRSKAGLIITPVFESHILETGTISDPKKREQVATVMVIL